METNNTLFKDLSIPYSEGKHVVVMNKTRIYSYCRNTEAGVLWKYPHCENKHNVRKSTLWIQTDLNRVV